MKKELTKGFTLIELLVTMIIIGILASIAVPVLRTNISAAKKTEALAAMGTIRTAEKLYFAEYLNYTDVTAGAWDASNLKNYIMNEDLRGRYYNGSHYSVDAANNLIKTTAGLESAPAAIMYINNGNTN